MNRLYLILICVFVIGSSEADPGRIYTTPDPASSGGIEGICEVPITHALAVDHDRDKVFRGEISDGGKTYRFRNIPVGKYDLVLVDAGKTIFEGLSLGDPPLQFNSVSMDNLKTRIDRSDAFFNEHLIQRMGTTPEHSYAFVERIRDHDTLTQGGAMMGNVRRLEIIRLDKAEDDWQLTESRHLYREEEPKNPNAVFMKHFFISELGNIRVIDSVKKVLPFSIPNS